MIAPISKWAFAILFLFPTLGLGQESTSLHNKHLLILKHMRLRSLRNPIAIDGVLSPGSEIQISRESQKNTWGSNLLDFLKGDGLEKKTLELAPGKKVDLVKARVLMKADGSTTPTELGEEIWVEEGDLKKSDVVRVIHESRDDADGETIEHEEELEAKSCESCKPPPKPDPLKDVGAQPITSSELRQMIQRYTSSSQVQKVLKFAKRNARRYTGYCYRYVKLALLNGGLLNHYPDGGSAVCAHHHKFNGCNSIQRDGELADQGFVNILDRKKFPEYAASLKDPRQAPVGSVLVYDGPGHGHIEIRTENGFIHESFSSQPITKQGLSSPTRRLVGVYIKAV